VDNMLGCCGMVMCYSWTRMIVN